MTGLSKPSRETKFSSVNGDRETFIFPAQLTTSRIGSLTWLILTLAIICDDHTTCISFNPGHLCIICQRFSYGCCPGSAPPRKLFLVYYSIQYWSIIILDQNNISNRAVEGASLIQSHKPPYFMESDEDDRAPSPHKVSKVSLVRPPLSLGASSVSPQERCRRVRWPNIVHSPAAVSGSSSHG